MARTRTIEGSDGREHEAEPVGFRTSGEHFNEYLLDDGTVLRIKLILTAVWKVKEAYDSLRNPLYVLEHQEVVAVVASDDVREGG